MTDQDLMPFGKYKGEKMERVPASYLLWLRDQGTLFGAGSKEVMDYINENETVLLSECPDHVDNKYKD